MHDLLLLENDLEVINDIISTAEKEIKLGNESKLTLSQKIIYPMMPFIFLISIIGLNELFTPNTLNIDIYLGLSLLGYATIFDMCIIGIILEKEVNLKHINGMKNRLSKAYELKE